MVELVAAAHRAIGAEQRQAGESEIADHVEHLVARAFVAVAQPLGIEQAGIVEHHRILERGAERKTGAPELGSIVHESEGPGAADFAAEPFRVEIEHIVLTADHRIGEVDFDLGTEAGRMGTQFAKRIAHRDLYRLQHLDEAARRRLCENAALIDRGDEGGGAAVHDRHFRAIELDHRIVDRAAGERRQQMLDRADADAFAIRQDRRKR